MRGSKAKKLREMARDEEVIRTVLNKVFSPDLACKRQCSNCPYTFVNINGYRDCIPNQDINIEAIIEDLLQKIFVEKMFNRTVGNAKNKIN